jgi:diaminohydroxyphosphoribosylaminopyrimidine deaminase/5-amino-6-(5-phosphoribosylamino)uracil reductase
MSLAEDEQWMRRALQLAELGRGHVEPNPLVGAVIVRDGRAVAEGWHRKFGGAHAEVEPLAAAGEAARGATLYVSLEPCCHFGKTPPCTEAIIRAGIARVVAAVRDPFPQVNGGGFRVLRAAGIEVVDSVCAAEASRLNAPFLTLVTAGRPYVHAKWAMTLDGKIATRTGHSQWISNEASRRLVHRLRGLMDGILVGIGTALSDDPQLTARPPGPRVATRIVLDSQARLPLGSQLVRTARTVPTLVVASSQAGEPSRGHLVESGCEVLTLAPASTSLPVAALLDELGRRKYTNVLVEGGGRVLGSFLDARLVDEVHIFIAPCLVGGETAPSPVEGTGAATVAEGLRLSAWDTQVLEGDIYVHGTR